MGADMIRTPSHLRFMDCFEMSKRIVVKYVVLAVWCALWLGLLYRYSAYFEFTASLSDWRFAALAAVGLCLAGFLGYMETQVKLAWIYGIFEYAIIVAGLMFGMFALLDMDKPRSYWWLVGVTAFAILESVDSFAKDLNTEKRWRMPDLLRSNKWQSRLIAFRYIYDAIRLASYLSVLLIAFLALFLL
jgi:hypothetical protein